MQKIVEHSEGIPRNINNLCFNALLAGYAAGRKQIDSTIVDQVLTDLEMNPPEPQGTTYQRFHLSGIDTDTHKTDPRGSDFADGGKAASEFDTPASPSVPQIPQAQPLPQRPRASGAEAVRDDFSGSRPDSRNGHRTVSGIGADPLAGKPNVTPPPGRPQDAQTAPGISQGDFTQRKELASAGIDVPYPSDSDGTSKRRVWGIATLAAVLFLASLYLVHSRVGASRRSQAPVGEAVAPSLTPLNVPAAASTSSGNHLITDATASQPVLTRNTGPKNGHLMSDPDLGLGDHDTGIADGQEGDADAEFALGARYALGNGVARDDKQAFALFRKAADQGNISAQSALATAYWLGHGVRQNNVAAYSWATIAHERGDAPSGELLKVLTGMMSPAELSEATSKAQEWQREHSTE